MFTGIIESVGVVKEKRNEGSNVVFRIESSIAQELKVDQSLAHDGVCLTVVSIQENEYEVVAIDETLRRTNLSTWLPGRLINLERAMKPSGRLDGHMVQGHVDTIARCSSIHVRCKAVGRWFSNWIPWSSKILWWTKDLYASMASVLPWCIPERIIFQ
jgi:riboflavin synthase